MSGTLMAGFVVLVALVMLAQFALSYWRSIVHAAAQVPLAEGVDALAAQQGTANAFEWSQMCPELDAAARSAGGRLRWARAYSRAVELAGRVVPGLKPWAEAETAACSRYAARLISDRVERNRRFAAQLLS